MGFEQVVPPIPDRKSEIDGLNRLEESWLNQPYYKYYMNESLRQPKLGYSKLINKYYSQFFFKTALAMVALLPLALYSKRFFVRQGRFPTTFQPDYFNRMRPDNHVRQFKYLKVVIPVHFATSAYLGWFFTDRTQVFDQNYQFVHKTRKIL